MSMAEALIMEIEQESRTTRAVLDRVPEDKLTWKPHEKSMSLGQLAHHVATIPGGIAQAASLNGMDFSQFTPPPQPETTAGIIAEFEQNVALAKQLVGGMDDAKMAQTWTLTNGEKTVMAVPRAGFVRFILCNHLYHHRGQLSVYLRLLNVPVPSIYGPSADENPFA
jgi:uncharacterized damage-inducible protein DinB